MIKAKVIEGVGQVVVVDSNSLEDLKKYGLGKKLFGVFKPTSGGGRVHLILGKHSASKIPEDVKDEVGDWVKSCLGSGNGVFSFL